MLGKGEVLRRIEDLGLVAVVRLSSSDGIDDVVESLGAAGARIIEITTTVPDAIKLISRYSAELGGDYVVGCGTVMDGATACNAMEAGARFIVSPVSARGVVEATRSSNALAIPGFRTPTEAWQATSMGAEALKLFPARDLGPRYISDLLGPMPSLRILPAGGIDPGNAGEYIRAGAAAVFSGSSLVNDRLVHDGRFEEIESSARQMLREIKNARVRER